MTGRLSVAYVVEQRLAGKKLRKQFSTKGAATKFAASLTMGSADVAASSRKTFSELADGYFDQITFNGLERATIKSYRSHVRCHLNPRLGETRVEHIGREKILATMQDLQANLSAEQTKNVFQCLRRILRFGVMSGVLHRDPAAGLTGPSQRVRHHDRGADLEDDERLHRFLSKSELARLALALRGCGRAGPLPMNRAMAFLAISLYSGLRASEVRGLEVRAINLTESAGAIRVYQRADEYQVIGALKSEQAYRTVPIPPELTAMIQRWIRVRGLMQKDLLLGSKEGTPLNPSNFYNRDYRGFLASAGLASAPATSDRTIVPNGGKLADLRPDFTIHSLRHSHASICIHLGMDAKTLSARMGHSTVAFTLDVYGHLWRDAEQDQRDMTALMAEIDAVVEDYEDDA